MIRIVGDGFQVPTHSLNAEQMFSEYFIVYDKQQRTLIFLSHRSSTIAVVVLPRINDPLHRRDICGT